MFVRCQQKEQFQLRKLHVFTVTGPDNCNSLLCDLPSEQLAAKSVTDKFDVLFRYKNFNIKITFDNME